MKIAIVTPVTRPGHTLGTNIVLERMRR